MYEAIPMLWVLHQAHPAPIWPRRVSLMAPTGAKRYPQRLPSATKPHLDHTRAIVTHQRADLAVVLHGKASARYAGAGGGARSIAAQPRRSITHAEKTLDDRSISNLLSCSALQTAARVPAVGMFDLLRWRTWGMGTRTVLNAFSYAFMSTR